MTLFGMVVRENGASYTVVVPTSPLSVGRAPESGIPVSGPSVSWHHAAVRADADGVWVRDLSSTNGVFVGDSRIRGEALVGAGGLIRLGQDVTLEVIVVPGTPVPAADTHKPTLHNHEEPFPYRLTVRLNAQHGPEAELTDRVSHVTLRLDFEVRVVLLYLLARKAVTDVRAGLPPDRVGWCEDDDLARGLWGRGQRASSTLAVTVHRLRKDIRQAGLDDQFLEKGRRTLRIRLVDIAIEPDEIPGSEPHR